MKSYGTKLFTPYGFKIIAQDIYVFLKIINQRDSSDWNLAFKFQLGKWTHIYILRRKNGTINEQGTVNYVTYTFYISKT